MVFGVEGIYLAEPPNSGLALVAKVSVFPKEKLPNMSAKYERQTISSAMYLVVSTLGFALLPGAALLLLIAEHVVVAVG